MRSSLSQDISKRGNGNKRYPANVTDIKARSPIRYNKSTGTGYQLTCSYNYVSLVLAQVGEEQDSTRTALVGEITPYGFKSLPTFEVDKEVLCWDDLAEIVGIDTDRLMVSVRKFASRFTYLEPKPTERELVCRLNQAAARRSQSVKRSNKIKFV